jgi:Ala-tRNA(Pro) deacylase
MPVEGLSVGSRTRGGGSQTSAENRAAGVATSAGARRVDFAGWSVNFGDRMATAVFDQIEALLSGKGLAYEVLRHAPVFTSAEAAAVRGTPLASGAKALVVKADERFVMFVVPADRKLASRQVRAACGIRGLRFADREEVERLTGLAPGAIPPFGSLFDLPTYCDARLAEHERINFNAGDHATSISLRWDDYIRAEAPSMGTFAD